MKGTVPWMPEDDFYSVSEAARVLRYSERHVRKLLNDGELQGERDEESGRWRVYQRSVHQMLPDRPPRVERHQEPIEGSERTRDLEDRMRDLYDRIASLQHDLGRAQAARELTERAESTVREQLELERRRSERLEAEIQQERDRATKERERALELELQLREARKGFWRRLLDR